MKAPLEEDIELIERYFDNALSEEEAGELKERLKSDTEFQKLFEREKLLIHTIRFEAASRDLDYLKDLEKSLSGKNTSDRRHLMYYLAAAASVAIIALAVWMPWGAEDPQDLYAEYYQPHANIFEPIMRSRTNATSRTEAFQAYEQGDYARASILFTQELSYNKDPGVLMLLGNANLMIGEVETAKKNFHMLIDDYDDLDVAAKWYLGLAHLKAGEVDAASEILADVSDSRSPYASQARDLLAELK